MKVTGYMCCRLEVTHKAYCRLKLTMFNAEVIKAVPMNSVLLLYMLGVHGDTALQAGMSRVRFPLGVIGIFR